MRQIDASDERLKGAVIVASVSGGKDSAAMSLALTQAGLDHIRVFADTGWEHPLTYEYLRGPLTKVLGPITEVVGRDGGMANLIRRKGMFASRRFRICTQELKVKPILTFLHGLMDQHTVVNAVGIRAGESEARSKMPEWEWSEGFDCWTWRPMLNWSEEDVIAAHTECGLRPNPLYLKGASRVGCFPCIMSRKKEVRLVAEMWPERIDEIRQLEQDVGDAAEARHLAKGLTADQTAAKGWKRPTFFEGTTGRLFPSIDEVVAWSKTAHGGKQLDLLPRDPQEGCVRWGLCETLAEEEKEDGDVHAEG